MFARHGIVRVLVTGIGILIMSISSLLAGCGSSEDVEWVSEFTVEKDEFASVGRNLYFILEPDCQLVLEDGGERLSITVLSETKVIDGVETRVVEERETKGGRLVEVSRNYFAISKRTNDVFYFGEDVDIYENGRVVSHEGAWQAGVDGARFGLVMPGKIVLGAGYQQETAPRVATDRARNISTNETVKTPAGEFKDCLKVEETTPLERGAKEYKRYAPGVGLVQDGSLKLVSVTSAS